MINLFKGGLKYVLLPRYGSVEILIPKWKVLKGRSITEMFGLQLSEKITYTVEYGKYLFTFYYVDETFHFVNLQNEDQIKWLKKALKDLTEIIPAESEPLSVLRRIHNVHILKNCLFHGTTIISVYVRKNSVEFRVKKRVPIYVSSLRLIKTCKSDTIRDLLVTKGPSHEMRLIVFSCDRSIGALQSLGAVLYSFHKQVKKQSNEAASDNRSPNRLDYVFDPSKTRKNS